jgi:hypothetical protein
MKRLPGIDSDSGLSARISAVFMLCVSFLAASYEQAQATVQTFTMVAGGESSCGTYQTPQPVLNFFGGIGSSIPTGGLAPCGVAGSTNLLTQPGGTLIDSASLDNIPITTTFSSGFFSGTSNAYAQHGKIGAAATASFSGQTDSNTVAGASSFGLFRETFTLAPDANHAAGTAGQIVFQFTIDGELSVNALGSPTSADATTMLNYQKDSGTIFNIFLGRVGSSQNIVSIPSGDASNFVGPNVVPGVSSSISGSGIANTFSIPFLYGVAFDLSVGLAATTHVSRAEGIASFLTTALLTGISVFDGFGAIADFEIGSGSGTLYDANGVHLTTTVPAPSAVAIFVLAVVGLGNMRWRGMKKPDA